MNNPLDSAGLMREMPDVQGTADARNLPIQRVGIRKIRYPVLIETVLGAEPQPSVGVFSLSVALPADRKGTHMSRFVALLEGMLREGAALSVPVVDGLFEDMLRLLEAEEGTLTVEAPFFIKKTAPVSGVASLMDYRIGLEAIEQGGARELAISAWVPVKSLCPCSKEISDYGAHNQRSEVYVRAVCQPALAPSITTLIQAIEQQASCELWGLLKRPDEKYVTERAYDNAKFVEDLVRDVALSVRALRGVQSACIEAENFESIHNHSAWARIEA
jgi:GTP cyclohydrolase I